MGAVTPLTEMLPLIAVFFPQSRLALERARAGAFR
jgi:hypothetical protein